MNGMTGTINEIVLTAEDKERRNNTGAGSKTRRRVLVNKTVQSRTECAGKTAGVLNVKPR